VEIETGLREEIGGDYKASTWTYVTQQGEREMKEQATARLHLRCEHFHEKHTWDEMNYAELLHNNGACPHCNKCQHWSPPVKEAGIGSLFIGILIISIIVMLIIIRILSSFIGFIYTYAVALWLGSSFAVSIFFTFLLRKEVKKPPIVTEPVADTEKCTPYFISWGKMEVNSVGLTIRN